MFSYSRTFWATFKYFCVVFELLLGMLLKPVCISDLYLYSFRTHYLFNQNNVFILRVFGSLFKKTLNGSWTVEWGHKHLTEQQIDYAQLCLNAALIPAQLQLSHCNLRNKTHRATGFRNYLLDTTQWSTAILKKKTEMSQCIF